MTLEAKTNEYWRVSCVWQGRSKEKITVARANKILGGILRSTNPYRPLAARVAVLSAEIVAGNCDNEPATEADNK